MKETITISKGKAWLVVLSVAVLAFVLGGVMNMPWLNSSGEYAMTRVRNQCQDDYNDCRLGGGTATSCACSSCGLC